MKEILLQVTQNEWYYNPFILAFYGWLTFNILMFSFSKESTDALGKKFQFKAYLNNRWDNWLATLFLAPLVALFAEEINEIIFNVLDKFFSFSYEYEFNKLYYTEVGVLAELIYMALTKLKMWKEKITK